MLFIGTGDLADGPILGRSILIESLRTWYAWTCCIGLLLLTGLGFWTHPGILSDAWTPAGQTRFLLFAAGYAGVTAVCWFLVKGALRPLVVLGGTVAACGAVGFAGPLSAAFFLLSSFVLGAGLLHGHQAERAQDPVEIILATLFGSCLYLTIVGWTAGLPVHYAFTHLAVLTLPLLIWPRLLGVIGASLVAGLRHRHRWDGPWHFAAFALAAFLPLVHLVPVLLPQVNNDAVVAHLAIPSVMAVHHFWGFDVNLYVWAVQPMGISWLLLPSYLLGGEYAARIVNFCFFLAAFLLIAQVARRYAPTSIAWLLAGVYASTPMLSALTGNIFSENLWVALLFASCLALDRFRTTGEERYFMMLVTLAAVSLSVKVLGAVLVAILFLAAAPAVFRRPTRLAAAVGIGLVCASYPYLYAFAKTGNPIFPYMNHIFKSPFYPVEAFLGASRTTPTSLYDVTFATHLYFDGGGRDGSFGFAYLVLLPLCTVVIRRGLPYLGALCLISALAFIASIALFAEANIRYFYPALPLLTLTLAFAYAELRRLSRALYLVVCSATAALVALNAYATPLSGWAFRDFPFSQVFTRSGVETYRDWAAPERRAIDYLNLTRGQNARVAFFSRPMLIDVKGEAIFTNWYNKKLEAQLAGANSPEQVLRIMRERRITHFIAFRNGSGNSNGSAAVEGFLARYTQAEFAAGDVVLSRFVDEVRFSEEVVRNSNFAAALEAWEQVGSPRYDPEAHKITVTSASALVQRVSADEHLLYRYAITARCPMPGTHLRLQVIWYDRSGESLPPTVQPRACSPQETTFGTDLIPPLGARAAALYVTGQEPDRPVEVAAVSLRW